MIAFVPQRGQILICDFDVAGVVPPEMRKTRRVVVVSPRAHNHRHGTRPGPAAVPAKCFAPVTQGGGCVRHVELGIYILWGPARTAMSERWINEADERGF